MTTYREVLAIRQFRYLYAGLVLSYIGDHLAALAVAVLIFDRTGLGVLSGLAHASSFLPALVAGSLLGALADRLPQRALLIACDAVRAVLVLALLIPGLPIWTLIVLLYATSLLTTPFIAARSVLITEILPGGLSIIGNGLNRITFQLCQLLAFGVGGLTVAAIGPKGALLANAATFVLSAALTVTGVKPRPRRILIAGDVRGPSGLRYVFRDPWLRGCLLLVWLVSAFVHAPEAIAYPYAERLGGGATVAGLLLSATALGFATGTAILTRLVSPRRRDRLLVPCAILAGAAIIPLATEPPLPVVLCLLVLSGLGCAFSAPLNALFVLRVEPAFRGRAMGVAVGGLAGAQGLGFLTAGALANVGLHPALVSAMCGAAATVAAVSVGLSWRCRTAQPRNLRR